MQEEEVVLVEVVFQKVQVALVVEVQLLMVNQQVLQTEVVEVVQVQVTQEEVVALGL
tara:strand:- start:58 stop:228 length:171 start_codon:yes stop_codon:yes gene_type:complete